MEVVEPEEFRGLTGPTVVESPAFQDNHLAYAVCYGLCVQGVGKGTLGTNLLPDEIFADRMVKGKKPWAVAAVALLMVGYAASFTGYWRGWSTVQIDEPRFKDAFDAIGSMARESSTAKASYDGAKLQLDNVAQAGIRLGGIAEQRLLWPELMKALNDCLPRDVGEPPKDISQRNQLHITRIDCEYFPDLSVWFTDVGAMWKQQNPASGAPAAATPPPTEPGATDGAAPPEAAPPAADGAPPVDPAAANGAAPAEPVPAVDAPAPPTDANAAVDPNAAAAPDPNAPADPNAATGEAAAVGPTGAGFAFEMEGHHYHNEGFQNVGRAFIRETLIKNLESMTVTLPVYQNGQTAMVPFTMKELGVDFPVITYVSGATPVTIGDSTGVNGGYGGQTPAPATTPEGAAAGANGQAAAPVTLREVKFRVQFCWKPTAASQRLLNREKDKPTKPAEELAAAPAPEQEAMP
jgi:type IV pilus assembly protein PilM